MLKLNKMRLSSKNSNGQRKFQCDFCPTRNTWVKYILVGKDKHHICPECIAELARQIRKEKEIKNAELQAGSIDGAAPDTNRGIGDNPVQTETPPNAT